MLPDDEKTSFRSNPFRLRKSGSEKTIAKAYSGSRQWGRRGYFWQLNGGGQAMSEAEQWFIVKQKNGQCAIAPVLSTNKPKDNSDTAESEELEQWGPFDSQSEAIARRVGLIRAGKCQPA